MAGKKSKEDPRSALTAELTALLPDIDEEGLAFLINQATTLIYNSKVEELNRSRERAEKLSGSSGRAAKKDSAPSVTITRSGRKGGFFLEIDRVRSILDEDELMDLVRIAHAAEDERDGAQRLFRRIEKDRDEIILDSGLSPGGEKTRALYRCLKENFAIRQE
jgi:hypothetical protein